MTDEELKAIEERVEQRKCWREAIPKGLEMATEDDISALLAEVKRLTNTEYCGKCGEFIQDGMCHCTVVAAFKGDSND